MVAPSGGADRGRRRRGAAAVFSGLLTRLRLGGPATEARRRHGGAGEPPTNGLVFATALGRVDRAAAADRAALRRLFSDPATWTYLGGPRSPERVEAMVESVIADPGDARVIRTAGSEAAGTLTLHPHHDGEDVEVSYLLAPAHRGRGLATLAVAGLLDHARRERGLTRLVAETQEANLPSRRLLERVGMVPERRLVRFGAPQVLYATALRP